MARRNGKRKSKRRTTTRRGKIQITSVLQALIIEGLAVAAILGLYFEMRNHRHDQQHQRWNKTQHAATQVVINEAYVGRLKTSFDEGSWAGYVDF